MSDDEWVMDDPQISDDELLYRRIPLKPDHCTFDPERGRWVPQPAAFRRDPGEGMSVHMDSVLNELSRQPHTLYDPESYGAVRFPAGVVRSAGAGVLRTPATVEDEADGDLREAHAEARPPTSARDRAFWSQVRHRIIGACDWVVQGAT